MDKGTILKVISDMIEEAWGLSEDMKKQVFKRLILQWHPDKNPGNEALCTEVFQHIMSEIERLERGESRRGEGCTPPGWTYQGSYGAFFNVWGRRARRYNSDRQEYSESFARHSGSWTRSSWYVPPSFCDTNPQPAEARRWFRQAEADLAAADNDIDTAKPSYVWACFKCHQVRILLIRILLTSWKYNLSGPLEYSIHITVLVNEIWKWDKRAKAVPDFKPNVAHVNAKVISS